MTPPPPPAATPPKEQTTWLERIGFASGTLPFNFGASGLNTIAYPIYNITLGMSPTLVGVVLGIGRLWDAFMDPVVGSMSDNYRSRWGRRRPFVAVGALLCALTFPLLWFVPLSWSANWAFGYFLVTALLFFTAFAVYGVPYLTLGYEMSTDSNERVRVTAVRAIVSKLTFFIVPWVFSVAQLPVFESTIAGMRTLGLIIGALFIVLAIPTVLFTRERYAKRAAAQAKIPLRASMRETLHNRPFLYLVGIVLGMLVGTNLVAQLGVYVNSYYVFAGDTVAGAMLHAKSQTLYAVAGMIAVPIVSRLATRHGKLRVVRWCIACGILASISKYFCYSREIPELQYVSMLLLSPSFSGFWVLVDPMKADVADYDEHQSGVRREGMYAAVANWFEKTVLTVAILVSGFVLDFSGFDVAKGGAQTPEALMTLRLIFAGVPAVLLAISLYLAIRYPLTDARVRTMKTELDQRAGATNA
ncbi:MAG: MFS transporter [Opitutae bacterium]|nr:MFS transporter [Opitutae bacterium]